MQLDKLASTYHMWKSMQSSWLYTIRLGYNTFLILTIFSTDFSVYNQIQHIKICESTKYFSIRASNWVIICNLFRYFSHWKVFNLFWKKLLHNPKLFFHCVTNQPTYLRLFTRASNSLDLNAAVLRMDSGISARRATFSP